MDFSQKTVRPIPFFMTWPGYTGTERDGNMLRDLEYLQQTYPNQVKGYQRRVAEILDRLDYEGSMIYDEYPDRCTLQKLTNTILQVLKQEEREEGDDLQSLPSEKWEWLEALIQVLLCNEIYKRRHGGRRSFFTI